MQLKCDYMNFWEKNEFQISYVSSIYFFMIILTVHFSYFLTLYALMDSSFWFDIINFGWSTVYIEGSQVIISK